MQLKVVGRLQAYIPLLCAVLTSIIVLVLMNRDYPNVGHDYRYFIVRMIDTKLSLLVNGPGIQWYTPSFGGGLPAYPNPQHIQYSAVQFFSLLMNPWLAILASTLVITCLGFMAFEQFLEKVMGFHWTSSTLGAIFFIGNGFFIEHMIVGHIGHQLFPLGSLILSAAADDRQPMLKSAAIIALILAMMIHQTGFYIIAILGLSLLIILPLIYLYNQQIFRPGLALRKLMLGLILAGIIAGSKIYAVSSLMRLFPRVASDFYAVGIFQAFTGLIAQLLGVMFLTPFLVLTGQDISLLSGSLSNITGAHYGIWETDIGLSPVLVILLSLALARLAGIARKNRVWRIKVLSHPIAWSVLLVGIWIALEMTFAKGILFPYIKSLPVLRSMHVNVRFAAVFVLPLTLVGIIEYESRSRTRPRQTVFLIAAGLAFGFLFLYTLFPADVHSRTYNMTLMLQTDSAIQRGERFPVDKVASIEEDAVFLEHATNVLYYEPLFSRYDRIDGYQLEGFDARVHPGAVTEIDNDYYNMTNPASLLFPKENNLRPFERIKVGEEEQLQAFLQRRQPQWKMPTIQTLLNWVSLGAFILTLGLIFMPGRSLTMNSAAKSMDKVIPPFKR